MGQHWLSVSAAAAGTTEKDGGVDEDAAGSAGKRIADGRRRCPQRWRQPKGKDRTEMKKEARVIEVHFAQWICLEYREKYMRRYNGKCDILYGIEHRLREGGNGGTVQQRSQGRTETCNAVDAARITNDRASSEDPKHTSGGVFVAVDSNLGAVVGGKKERLVRSQATMEESPKHG